MTAGRVSGVWTERGLIKASTVVVAGGVWSSRFCRHHDVELPVANIGATALRTEPAPDVLTVGNISTGNMALRRRVDGGYTVTVPGYGTLNIAPQSLRYATKFYQLYRANLTKKLKYRINNSFFSGPEAFGSWHNDQVSPFERIRVLDPAPEKDLVQLAMRTLASEFPALKDVKVAASWGALIDTSPDLVPIISYVEGTPGLVIASGCSGHGFGIGPGAGRLVAELCRNEKPFTDLAAYKLKRFSDGSAIRRPDMI
jgi:glycine/D-amino acid oxidase-like deaminating enzyme